MIRIRNVLLVVFLVVIFTAQSRRPEGEERQHFSAHNSQTVRSHQESVAHTSQVMHRNTSTPRISKQRSILQSNGAQTFRQAPRIYPVISSSSVGHNEILNHQHHRYWHPRYNFYQNQYHFYPYINVASMVELSPDYVAVSFNGENYYYDHWTFYEQDAQGYMAVPPPIGAIVTTISSHAVQVIINGEIYYNYNDVYYKPVPQGYEVVEPLH